MRESLDEEILDFLLENFRTEFISFVEELKEND